MADEPLDEIKVTPEMIRAGAVAGWRETEPPRIVYEIVERVYRAMRAIERQALTKSGA